VLPIIEAPPHCSGGIDIGDATAGGKQIARYVWFDTDAGWEMHLELLENKIVHYVVHFLLSGDDEVTAAVRLPSPYEKIIERLDRQDDLARLQERWPRLRTLRANATHLGAQLPALMQVRDSIGETGWLIVSARLEGVRAKNLDAVWPALSTATNEALHAGLDFIEELPGEYAQAVVTNPDFDVHRSALTKGAERIEEVSEWLHRAKDVLDVLGMLR
jgi:hypothetical protein